MGVRPPQDDDDDRESIEFGIAAVDARLRGSDLSFPASRADVDRALGTSQIPYDVYGNTVELATIVEETDSEQFDTRQQLLNELHPAFEAYRARHSGGIVAQFRSMLPF